MIDNLAFLRISYFHKEDGGYKRGGDKKAYWQVLLKNYQAGYRFTVKHFLAMEASSANLY